MVVRDVVSADAQAIARIYNHYVRNSIISFEEDDVDAAEMARRIGEVAAANLPWLVCERDRAVIGFAFSSKWKARAATVTP
jgi:phosphinothricin acetyltransferase